MFIKKSWALSATLFAVAATIASPAHAEYGYSKSRFKKGRAKCEQVVQVVDIGGYLQLKNYGNACQRHGGQYSLTSRHEHPHRYGNELFIWRHGHLVAFHDNRGYYKQSKARKIKPLTIGIGRHYNTRATLKSLNKKKAYKHHSSYRNRGDYLYSIKGGYAHRY